MNSASSDMELDRPERLTIYINGMTPVDKREAAGGGRENLEAGVNSNRAHAFKDFHTQDVTNHTGQEYLQNAIS